MHSRRADHQCTITIMILFLKRHMKWIGNLELSGDCISLAYSKWIFNAKTTEHGQQVNKGQKQTKFSQLKGHKKVLMIWLSVDGAKKKKTYCCLVKSCTGSLGPLLNPRVGIHIVNFIDSLLLIVVTQIESNRACYGNCPLSWNRLNECMMSNVSLLNIMLMTFFGV